MADKKQIAVIVEGEKRELDYWDSLAPVFFPKTDVEVLPLPLHENIYMLYGELAADGDLDVVEVVRERSAEAGRALEGKTRKSFQEVYLFLDFDPHAYERNIKKTCAKTMTEIVEEMLSFFDNETEQGKLYISYPMCEALRDGHKASCAAHYRCVLPLEEAGDYKRLSSDGNPFASKPIHTYTEGHWEHFCAAYLHKYRCLRGEDVPPEQLYLWYKREEQTPLDVFQRERALLERSGGIFVISAFPEFLLDYFKESRWSGMLGRLTGIARDCRGKDKDGSE
ncbi:MAG: hypothetical protein IJT71_03070 [Oscillospiraceae bacterium]|nr:hypothetical protein [Oscillospiraceae bacterium]